MFLFKSRIKLRLHFFDWLLFSFKMKNPKAYFIVSRHMKFLHVIFLHILASFTQVTFITLNKPLHFVANQSDTQVVPHWLSFSKKKLFVLSFLPRLLSEHLATVSLSLFCEDRIKLNPIVAGHVALFALLFMFVMLCARTCPTTKTID